MSIDERLARHFSVCRPRSTSSGAFLRRAVSKAVRICWAAFPVLLFMFILTTLPSSPPSGIRAALLVFLCVMSISAFLFSMTVVCAGLVCLWYGRLGGCFADVDADVFKFAFVTPVGVFAVVLVMWGVASGSFGLVGYLILPAACAFLVLLDALVARMKKG